MGTASFEPPRRVGRRPRPAIAEVIAHVLARRSTPLDWAAPLVPHRRHPDAWAQRWPIAGVWFGIGGTTLVEVTWLRRRASVTGPPSVDSMTDR